MTTSSTTQADTPRLWGIAPIVPLSLDQYRRMVANGIISKSEPVEWQEGYLVARGQDLVQSPVPTPAAAEPPRLHGLAELWPLSLDQYHRMIASGIVGEGAPVEFIAGYLVSKDRGRGYGVTHGPTHASAVQEIYDQVRAALPRPIVVRSQLPITLGPADLPGAGHEPEPDLSVARGPKSRYRDHHPGPSELLLVAEAADSSLTADRRSKAGLYASAGIAPYWIVNLVTRQLEVYTNPNPVTGQYDSREVLTEDQEVTLVLEGSPPVTFRVKDLLP